MSSIWLAFTLVFMFADWIALWKHKPSYNYLTKPLTLLFLLLWFWASAGGGWAPFSFMLGLFFSLTGDAFLLLPHGYFKHGLAAFLLAHLAYLAGFVQGLKMLPLAFWVLAAALGGVMVYFTRQLVRGAKRNPRHRRMVLPIILYAGAIGSMFLLATWTLFRADWGMTASVLAACGALMFLFSDLYLASDRFVKPIPNARLMVRITYHLGQLGLAAGVILFSKPI